MQNPFRVVHCAVHICALGGHALAHVSTQEVPSFAPVHVVFLMGVGVGRGQYFAPGGNGWTAHAGLSSRQEGRGTQVGVGFGVGVTRGPSNAI